MTKRVYHHKDYCTGVYPTKRVKCAHCHEYFDTMMTNDDRKTLHYCPACRKANKHATVDHTIHFNGELVDWGQFFKDIGICVEFKDYDLKVEEYRRRRFGG